MKRHNFNQDEIYKSVHTSRQEEQFRRFVKIVNELGYTIRVTGGAFLTHEINTTEEEFNIILELL